MKKYSFVPVLAIVFLLVSCKGNDSGGMSARAQKNLDAMRATGKAFETGDVSKLGDYIATDGVDHSGMTGDVKGLDGIKAEFTQASTMMTDMKNEVVKEFADDDYVMSWMKETGTMKVDGMGMKAGQHYSWDAIEVSKYNADSKATDHWSFISYGDMMKMMPPPPPMVDTTKKM